MPLKFEWDEDKAKANYVRHGVSFQFAARVFEDPFALEFLDDRDDYGEERFVIIGSAVGCILYVAYTERDEVIRMISARQADKT